MKSSEAKPTELLINQAACKMFTKRKMHNYKIDNLIKQNSTINLNVTVNIIYTV